MGSVSSPLILKVMPSGGAVGGKAPGSGTMYSTINRTVSPGLAVGGSNRNRNSGGLSTKKVSVKRYAWGGGMESDYRLS